MREAILRQGHIQTEIVAGFEIVEIGVCIGVLCGDVIEEFFSFHTREKFAYGCKRIVVSQVYLRFAVSLQCFERFSCLVRPQNDVHIVVMAYQFFTVRHQPLAKTFVAADFLQYHDTADIFAKPRFDEIFCLRVFEIGAKVGHDAWRILNIHGRIAELRER